MFKIGDVVNVSIGRDRFNNRKLINNSMAIIRYIHKNYVLIEYINNCKFINNSVDMGIVYLSDIKKVNLFVNDPRK